jgi:hypothetical protein
LLFWLSLLVIGELILSRWFRFFLLLLWLKLLFDVLNRILNRPKIVINLLDKPTNKKERMSVIEYDKDVECLAY